MHLTFKNVKGWLNFDKEKYNWKYNIVTFPVFFLLPKHAAE